MKIEAGKFYKTRDGRKVGPMVTSVDDDQYAFYAYIEGERGNKIFQADGKHGGTKWIFNEPDKDIVGPWTDLTPHQQRTAEMIKVMQAYVDGEKIEYKGYIADIWADCSTPIWSWPDFDYRITSATTPDTIDWSHVAPEFKWMARDEDGTAWLFKSEPRICNEIEIWTCKGISNSVTPIASYRPGTCDWKDSLVKRPE